MKDLKLEQDEKIIKRRKEVWKFDGNEECELEALFLTNKHLISVYEKSKFLIKTETIVDKRPLSLISSYDGVLQVNYIVDDNFGKSLQILYDNGMEELYFFGDDATDDDYQQWENAIKKNVPEQDVNSLQNKTIVAPVLADENHQDTQVEINQNIITSLICDGCGEKNVIGARFCQHCGKLLQDDESKNSSDAAGVQSQQSLINSNNSQVYKEYVEKSELSTNLDDSEKILLSVENIGEQNKITSIAHMICPNCGAKNSNGTKYCGNCGFFLTSGDRFMQVSPSFEVSYSEPKPKFAGQIIKCPSCGEVMKAFEVKCPACGYELRDAKISNAVAIFSEKLQAIESGRESKNRGLLGFGTLQEIQYISKTDEQKINLIRNFSIPNSKEDLLEFMILATSNINIDVYSSLNTPRKSEQEINAAWYSKAQQVYEKAKKIYANDDEFLQIKELYDNCNKKIKKSKRKKLLIIVSLVFMDLFAIALMMLIFSVFGDDMKPDQNQQLEGYVNYNADYRLADGLLYDNPEEKLVDDVSFLILEKNTEL